MALSNKVFSTCNKYLGKPKRSRTIPEADQSKEHYHPRTERARGGSGEQNLEPYGGTFFQEIWPLVEGHSHILVEEYAGRKSSGRNNYLKFTVLPSCNLLSASPSSKLNQKPEARKATVTVYMSQSPQVRNKELKDGEWVFSKKQNI